MATIYFDYNATTPLDPAVRQAMLPLLDQTWGNPSSVHHVGRRARAWLDEARDRASQTLGGKPSEIVFTSGGTESSNLAILGTARLRRGRGTHLITSQIEHHAVLHACQYLEKREGFTVTYLPVDREGRVSPDDLKRALRPDTILISIMAANNEVGTLQPIAELGAICKEQGIVFHTDAVQWFGKEPFTHIDQFNADLVSICGHKFHGPKGSGLLYIRSPLLPEPILLGGGHENERRAGTENLAGIAGLVECLERFIKEPVFPRASLRELTTYLHSELSRFPELMVISPTSDRLANTVACVVPQADGIALLAALDLAGICASSGSACSAGSLEPSHVVAAMGLPEGANSLVRFSLGRESTRAEIAELAAALPIILARVITPA